jgi:hypothetical protein
MGNSKDAAMFIRLTLALLLLVVAQTAEAAPPVFPAGSRIGLVPPPGLVPSTRFEGFQDRDEQVAIMMLELGKADAYANLDKEFSADAVRANARGIELDSRNEISLPEGHGFILVERQTLQGVKYRKWLLVAAIADLTVLVRVQVPETSKDAYPDEVIRSALATTAVRTSVPVEEQLGVLPYQLKNLAGFRIVHTAPDGSALLTDGAKDDLALDEQAVFLISVGPSAPERPEDRDSLARRIIATTPGVKGMQIERAGPLRIGGMPGEEMIVQAKDAKSATDLTVVQWLRFGSSATMRLLGITRKDAWDAIFPRFRAVRDGVVPK